MEIETTEAEHTLRDHFLTNAMYDNIKSTAQVGLPAAGTLYFALAQIWGLPYGEQIVGTIVAVDAFLGVLLHYSTKSYNASDTRFAGNIEIFEEDGVKRYSLNLNSDPNDLDKQNEVTFKISPKSGQIPS